MSDHTTIPYVTAFANELVAEPIRFEQIEQDLLRLAYRTPHPTDWVNGILRARVLDLRDQPDQRGPERMGKLNTLRQWRAMDKLLCQVCAEPAANVRTGRVSWLLTEAVFQRTGSDSGHTDTPPTCPDCVDDALKQCPALRDGAGLYTVAAALPAGVLVDLYRPARDLMPVLYGHNMFVPWHSGPAAHHRGGLATRQVVHLHGMKAVI